MNMNARKIIAYLISLLLLAGMLSGCTILKTAKEEDAPPAQATVPAQDRDETPEKDEDSDEDETPEKDASEPEKDEEPADGGAGDEEPAEDPAVKVDVLYCVDLALNPDLTASVPAGRYSWCQLAENGRLYARDDSGAMDLLLDRTVSSLSQHGSLVAYSLGEDGGYYIDLESGESGCFCEGYVGAAAAMNDCVVFLMQSPVGGNADLYVCSIRTGETACLAERWKHEIFCGGDDTLVYMDYADDTGEELVGVDCADWTELWRMKAETGYAQLCMQGGELFGRDGDTWFRMDMRTQEVSPLRFDLRAADTLLYVGADGAWVCDNNYPETSVVFATADARTAADYPFQYAEPFGIKEDAALISLLAQAHSDTLEYNYIRSRTVVLDAGGGSEDITALGKYGQMFASGDFPILDGSLARVPVMNDIYSFFCLENGIEGREPILNNTHGAWLALADRTSDIALLAAPTDEEKAYLEEKGVEVEMKLYGGDGLVFIGNRACGVADITAEQIRAIYRGEITNWKELGGVDHEIRVLYRNDQSGSQRLFEQMVWEDGEVPDLEALGFDCLNDMKTIVSECISDPYAFGYSIMTYLGDAFYAYEELQTFSVNGYEAVPENIRSGDYVYGTKGYVVIRADEPADSPARRLSEWFGSDPADQILLRYRISPISE